MLQTVTLTDSIAADKSFLLKSQVGSRAVYMQSGTTISEPTTFEVEVVSKDLTSSASDRVTLRVAKVKRDPDTNAPITTAVSVQFVLPRNDAAHEVAGDGSVEDLFSMLSGFIPSNLTKLENGIIP